MAYPTNQRLPYAILLVLTFLTTACTPLDKSYPQATLISSQ